MLTAMNKEEGIRRPSNYPLYMLPNQPQGFALGYHPATLQAA